jgi:hypothetical protein
MSDDAMTGAPPTEATTSDDAAVPYIERTRDYYAALGYPAYRWAEHAEVPFARLRRPLAATRVALVTTAAPVRPETPPPGRTYCAAARFAAVTALPSDAAPALRIDHVAIDFAHTTGADPGSFLPLAALRRAAAAGRIGGIAPHLLCVPTNRSQRHTIEVDAPALLQRVQADGAGAAVLVPNCPVCHQTLALMARMLEENGIATVLLGCAKDVVERAGVPRFLFSDFPLGNAAGRPHDPDSQDLTLGLALDLLEQATTPRTTVQSPLKWAGDPGWKRDYGRTDHLTPDAIARLKAEFEAQKAVAKGIL